MTDGQVAVLGLWGQESVMACVTEQAPSSTATRSMAVTRLVPMPTTVPSFFVSLDEMCGNFMSTPIDLEFEFYLGFIDQPSRVPRLTRELNLLLLSPQKNQLCASAKC